MLAHWEEVDQVEGERDLLDALGGVCSRLIHGWRLWVGFRDSTTTATATARANTSTLAYLQ